MKKIVTALGLAGLGLLAVPPVAYATTGHTGKCAAGVQDHVTKTDTGHGTPAEWADLSFRRYAGIQCTSPGHYEVLLTDDGTLSTRPGAGTPNGTGGTIAHRVTGTVHGVYGLKVTGELAVPAQRDTTLSSTEYVRQLFKAGATVAGGEYAWTYTTRCGEKWLDWSKNNDGAGAQAGNITGKLCQIHRRPTPTPTPTDSSTPSPTPSDTTAPGEAPAPTPVNSDLPVTG